LYPLLHRQYLRPLLPLPVGQLAGETVTYSLPEALFSQTLILITSGKVFQQQHHHVRLGDCFSALS